MWTFSIEPLKGKRFVGGYYAKDPKYDNSGRIIVDPYNLNSSRLTFFGVEEQIFRSIINIARHSENIQSRVPIFEQTEHFYNGISVLRDGTIISPIEFLSGVERVEI